MKTLQIVLIIFGVFIISALSLQYLQRDKRVIEGFATDCPTGTPCPKGCNPPTKISENCSEIYKEDTGRCYKLCPYECTDPLSDCVTNECCDGCGKLKIYVDCQTGEELTTSEDLNVSSQETNHSASSINMGVTDTSKNDIQGSVLKDDDRDNGVVANTLQTSVQPTAPPAKMEPMIIEYHNHYYGIIPNNAMINGNQVTQMNVPLVDSTTDQKGTPNKYRQGGDISDNLDDQTKMMEYGLNKKQDATTVMNYGAYGSPQTSNAITTYNQQPTSNLSATGMYMENTTPGFNSLYTLKF